MKDETYTLVIYEQVPESMDVFLVPDSEITDQVREWLSLAHNVIVNGEDAPNAGTDFLCSATLNEQYRGRHFSPDGIPAVWECWLRRFEIPLDGSFSDKHISTFIRSTFLM